MKATQSVAFRLHLTQNEIIEYLETRKEKRLAFLQYIKQQFNPSLVYYPASGWDTVPKAVFGKFHVIHLSLPQDEQDRQYLSKLGDGFKLLGDMKKSPLADASMDMILIHAPGIGLTPKMLSDFDRVLKPHGIVVIEGYGWTYSDRNQWDKFSSWFKNYRIIDLPSQFESGQNRIGVYKELDGYHSGWYVDSEEAMVQFVTSHTGYSGFNEILDYSVFQKQE